MATDNFQQWNQNIEEFLLSILADCEAGQKNCEREINYNGRCKYFWTIPSIVLSSIMSPLTQAYKNEVELISMMTMSAFVLIAFTNSIAVYMDFGKKCEKWNQASFKYHDLITDIRELLCKDVRGEAATQVRTIKMKYDTLVGELPNPY